MSIHLLMWPNPTHGRNSRQIPCLQGADPSASNDQEQTPLYKAVEAKQAACAQILCQAGPHAVNKADEWGLCPLHIAARAGDVDIVTLLLLAQVRTADGHSTLTAGCCIITRALLAFNFLTLVEYTGPCGLFACIWCAESTKP